MDLTFLRIVAYQDSYDTFLETSTREIEALQDWMTVCEKVTMVYEVLQDVYTSDTILLPLVCETLK